MLTDLHRKNRQIFAAIVTIMATCFSFASMHVYTQQKELLIDGLKRKSATEADLLGSNLTDSMLRHDYSEGRRILASWPGNHPDVAHLKIIFDNGRVFFDYGNANHPDAFVTVTRDFQYLSRSLTLTISHTSLETRNTLANLSINLFVLSVLLIFLVGLSLWFVLFRWMITPMEQEIASQTRELRAAKDNLETQVQERTASLSAEIEIRKQAEQSLRKLVRAVEQSPVLIFITNTHGIIEYVNPKFEQITGYSREEVVGKTPRILKSPDTDPALHRDLWATITAGNEWHHEMKDRCKDGTEFWANVSISPIRNPEDDITHFIALHEDITERKLAEQAMHDAQQAAELANKAKTDLLANMSHELRTPLNAIIGFSETMKHSVFGPLGSSQYEEYADFIFSSGTHLLQLINDILDVSAVEAGKLKLRDEPLSVADICDAAIQIVYPKARDTHIDITPIATLDLPMLCADPLRLKQIFINLLSNAVKFTPEHGSITCTAYTDEAGGLVITVTDTGIGMDQDSIAKAMEKFGQVDSSLSRKHEGTGLGLPLTKGLVELHGGTLEIDSTPGEGTRVAVHFPAERTISLHQKEYHNG